MISCGGLLPAPHLITNNLMTPSISKPKPRQATLYSLMQVNKKDLKNFALYILVCRFCSWNKILKSKL